MNSILIQKVASNGLTAKLHDASAFQRLIADTETYLLKLKQALIEARVNNDLSMPYCLHLRSRMDKSTLCNVFIGPFDQHISDLSLESIEEIILFNNSVASVLANGIDEKSVDLAHGKCIYVAKEKDNLEGFISRYALIKPDICPKCTLSVVETTIEDHMKTVGCMDRALHNMLEANQLTQMNSEVEEQLIRTQNVPYEHHPVQYGIFVPKWVDQAIKTYDSLRNRGGFQDMTLAEYLTNMAPE